MGTVSATGNANDCKLHSHCWPFHELQRRATERGKTLDSDRVGGNRQRDWFAVTAGFDIALQSVSAHDLPTNLSVAGAAVNDGPDNNLF